MDTTHKQILAGLRVAAEKMYHEGKAVSKMPEKLIRDIFREIEAQQRELDAQNAEIKLSDQEMESQRIKFAGLYDLAPVGYFILNSSGLIEEVNTTGIKLLNTGQKIVGEPFPKFITPEDTNSFNSFFQRLLSSPARQNCQISMISPTGKGFYAQIEGSAIRHGFTGDTRCCLAVIDITERMDAKIKQRDILERLALALDASKTGTWEINTRSGKISMDGFGFKILGLKPDFDGNIQSFLNNIHNADRKKVEERLYHSINEARELDIEFRVLAAERKIRIINARGHIVPAEKEGQDTCFVGLLTDITEKKLQEREALSLKINQQKALQAAALQAQEKERQRISEALHDSVSQLLYGAKLKLDHNKEASEEFPELVKQIKQMLDQAIKETRNISFELAPSILKDFGLASTIDEMAKRLCTNSLSISSTIATCNHLSIALQTNIFRIIQELTNNSIKHSGATKLHISIAPGSKSLVIIVTDNGKGFLQSANPDNSGTGLASIKNRISLFNGKMKIESKPGTGTKVHIALKLLC
ncbi:MAG: domain S-box protein [Sphingobacteriaceae bacterium]|jgi:PAS domain S-box-containing protein|nr:domain S-box protein [Sphingobacteriaceae bacterium]